MIVGGLVLLAAGAEGLVRGSAGLALRMGVTPLVVGLTVVAFGTGSPELVVGVEAAWNGKSDMALGNVLGSNISNVALILGVAALVRPLPVHSELLRREIPVLIGVTLLLCLLLWDGALSRFDGLMLLAGSVVYTIAIYALARRRRDDSLADEYAEELSDEKRHASWLAVLFVVAGLAALIAGAQFLVDGAVFVAESLGISRMVIGLTVIAIGTSLPELATSVLATARRESEVAIGNVFGSNILNILAILGATAIIHPISADDLRLLDLGAFVLAAVALVPLLWSGSILSRLEGVLLVVGYAVYIYTLVP